MSVTITTKSHRLMVKLDDEQSEELFRKLVGLALGLREETSEPEFPEVNLPPTLTEKEAVPDTEVEQEDKGYTGFLLIKCPKCGDETAFCAKKPMKSFICRKCRSGFELKDLRKLYLNCECGAFSYYLTNATDSVLEVECINCGAPVAVEFNHKKNLYETIRE